MVFFSIEAVDAGRRRRLLCFFAVFFAKDVPEEFCGVSIAGATGVVCLVEGVEGSTEDDTLGDDPLLDGSRAVSGTFEASVADAARDPTFLWGRRRLDPVGAALESVDGSSVFF